MLRMQSIRERTLQASYGATTEITGPLQHELAALAAQCGIKWIPQFYFTKNNLNAVYVSGSRFPYRMRPGKIFVSHELVDFVSRDTLHVFVAHEFGHREKDTGGIGGVLSAIPFPFRAKSARILREEIDADAFAARCMGKTKVLAAFEELTRLASSPKDNRLPQEESEFLKALVATGGLKKETDEFPERIRALNETKQP